MPEKSFNNKISLLIPCYNAESYIDSFISHVNKLPDKFDEIIFYNDGSTDSTLTLLKKSGYIYISSEINKGPGYARNRLAEAATGDFIHFHDVDDEFSLDFLQLVKEKIDPFTTKVILGYADWLDQKTRDVVIQWRYDQTEILRDPLSYFIINPLGIINTVYERQCFLSINGFNEDISCWEDADLHTRLAACKVNFSVIPQVIAYSIRHNSGISKNQKWCWNCRLKFLDSYMTIYAGDINKQIFKDEVKKVQTAFVNTAAYDLLGNIILINKKHMLGLTTIQIQCIYYLNKYFLPKFIIQKLLTTYKLISQWK